MSPQSEQAALSNPERVFVLSGPSGVGKNAVAEALRKRGVAVRAVTATSRAPRPGERDGVDYHFVSDEVFEDRVRQGRLLEHTRYCGHYYGTPASSVNEAARGGRAVVLVIDVDGALQLKRQWPGLRLIFLAPTDEQALRDRLLARGDVDDAGVASRLARAREEMALSGRYDWTVVNDRLDDAVQGVAAIIESEMTG